MDYNIIASVGTTEVELAPYPGGRATVPLDAVRKIYVVVLNNQASTTNTLTLKVYKDGTVEASAAIAIEAYGTVHVASGKKPVLIVPSGRTLKAVASAESVTVLMTGVDE